MKDNIKNIIILLLSFLIMMLSFLSIKSKWQTMTWNRTLFFIETTKVESRGLFDSNNEEKTPYSILFEYEPNSITNGIAACLGITIISSIVIFINPFKRNFSQISDIHYHFIERVLIRFLSILIIMVSGSGTLLGFALSFHFCMNDQFGSSESSEYPTIIKNCYSIYLNGAPISYLDNFLVSKSIVSSSKANGFYYSATIFFLSIILFIVIQRRYTEISPNLFDLGIKPLLKNKLINNKNNNNSNNNNILNNIQQSEINDFENEASTEEVDNIV